MGVTYLKKSPKKISFEKIIKGLKGWDKGGTINFVEKGKNPQLSENQVRAHKLVKMSHGQSYA